MPGSDFVGIISSSDLLLLIHLKNNCSFKNNTNDTSEVSHGWNVFGSQSQKDCDVHREYKLKAPSYFYFIYVKNLTLKFETAIVKFKEVSVLKLFIIRL